MLGFICGKWFWYTLRRVVKEEILWGRVGLELVRIRVQQPSQNLSHGEISYPYPCKIPLAYRSLAKSL